MAIKVSIVIPVYNVEKYLANCVESLINQTHVDLEIILINDQSTDSSGELCDQLAATDNRIKVVHKENGGLSSARNVGIQNVSGDFICFLDSDDWMNTNAISDSVKLSIEHNADIVFWSFIKEFVDKSEHYQVYKTENEYEVFEFETLDKLKRRSVGLVKEEMLNPTKTDSLISAWGKLYRTSLIKNNSITFLPTHLVGSEDVLFNIEAFYFSSKIVFLNKHYNHYRMFNDNSLTKNHKNTLFARFKNLYNYTFKFLESKNVPGIYYEALDNRFALTLINNCLSISSPRYDVSMAIKFNDIRGIIYDEVYIKALSKLDTAYLPIVWKLFFNFAKKKHYRSLLVMTLLYRKFK
jgi:glycosyltransferase EpsH